MPCDTVWKQVDAQRYIVIPRLPNDAWCDANLEAKWTMQNKQAL